MDPISLKAYKIFIEELEKQRVAIEDFRQRAKEVSAQEAEDLRIIFHRIKGGGGFFGLHNLSKAAGALEDIILQGCKNPNTIQHLIVDMLAEIQQVQASN